MRVQTRGGSEHEKERLQYAAMRGALPSSVRQTLAAMARPAAYALALLLPLAVLVYLLWARRAGRGTDHGSSSHPHEAAASTRKTRVRPAQARVSAGAGCDHSGVGRQTKDNRKAASRPPGSHLLKMGGGKARRGTSTVGADWVEVEEQT